MAKICENIICGEKYFFINQENELVCSSKNQSEMLMPYCSDFDAIENDDCIHIAARDKEGNLMYIINQNDHWGRGVAASGVMAENIFIHSKQEDTVIFYVSGDRLYKMEPDGADRQSVPVDEILNRTMPFVCGDRVYYINKNEKLCTNGGEEICEGRDITHIFATEEYLCVKDKNQLDLISTGDFATRQSLTRRHGRSAQCPVIVGTGDREILCWCDGDNVVFSEKEEGLWHSLETIDMQNAERLGIFKFDGKYDLGCLKNRQICSFNIRKPEI